MPLWKGGKLEYTIYDHSLDLWRINDMIVPMVHPELPKQWVAQNESIHYDGTDWP
jgi:hypothetical protein